MCLLLLVACCLLHVGNMGEECNNPCGRTGEGGRGIVFGMVPINSPRKQGRGLQGGAVVTEFLTAHHAAVHILTRL